MTVGLLRSFSQCIILSAGNENTLLSTTYIDSERHIVSPVAISLPEGMTWLNSGRSSKQIKNCAVQGYCCSMHVDEVHHKYTAPAPSLCVFQSSRLPPGRLCSSLSQVVVPLTCFDAWRVCLLMTS